MVSFAIPLDLLDQLEKVTEQHPQWSRSQIIREMCRLGLQLHQYREIASDPGQSDEFQRKMKATLLQGRLDKYLEDATTSELSAIRDAANLEYEMRCRNLKLDRIKQRVVRR